MNHFKTLKILGASGFAMLTAAPIQAATVTTPFTADWGLAESSCTIFSPAFVLNDCSYNDNDFGTSFAGVTLADTGPLTSGGYYAPGTSPTPAASAPGDGKIAIPVAGTVTVDDQGNGLGADDTIALDMTIGAGARLFDTGTGFAAESFTSWSHVMAATPVTAATPDGMGGIVYEIGIWPGLLAGVVDGDRFGSSESAESATALNWNGWPAAAPLEPPGFADNVPTQQGGTTTGTLQGYVCESLANPAPLDCSASVASIGNAGPTAFGADFDNVLARVHVDGSGNLLDMDVIFVSIARFTSLFGSAPDGWTANSIRAVGDTSGAGDDAYEVVSDSIGNLFDIGANDTGFSDPVMAMVTQLPDQGGTATIQNSPGPVADVVASYSPAPGFAGIERFVYEVDDGQGGVDTATVTVTVQGTASPVASDAMLELVTQGEAPMDVSADLDIAAVPGNSLGNTPSQVSTVDGARGGTQVAGTVVTYQPASDFFSGTDTFTYTITDADSEQASASVTVTIPDIDPVVADLDATVVIGLSGDIDLVAGTTPGNGSVADHTFAIASQPGRGSVSLNGGVATYTPAAEFVDGTDTFAYSVADGDGSTTVTATVTVAVRSDFEEPEFGSSALGPVTLFGLFLMAAVRRGRRLLRGQARQCKANARRAGRSSSANR